MDVVQTALFTDLRSSSRVETFQPEVWLKTRAVRDRFQVFQNDCDLERGGEPLEDAVIFMSVQAIIDKSTEYNDVLTKDAKIELRWQKVSHYFCFVTGLVSSQKARGGIWSHFGNEFGELKHLCGLALRVLVSFSGDILLGSC
jgi:hypothetical protein